MKSRFLSNPNLGLTLPVCLLASVFAAAGCFVYDDELLRRREDAGLGGKQDDAAVDVPRWETLPPNTADSASDPVVTIDAMIPDVGADIGSNLDANTVSDAPWQDASARDAVVNDGDGKSLDAAVRADAPSDARDADAIGSPADVSPSDGRDADADTQNDAPGLADEGVGVPDARVDADAAEPPPPTFRVLRIGDGTSALSTASTRGFLEERTFDGTLAGPPLALPFATSGSQHACTFAGSATAEGSLSRSSDGRFVTLAGYASPPGVDAIPSSDVARVVARVDRAGAIDTSTSITDAFDRGNVRGATSLDGLGFWVSGTGRSKGGIWYAPFGGGTSTHIVTSPDNVRWLHVVAGQLYASSGASPQTNVFAVGNGTPTAGAQNVTALAGMPDSGMSPYAFAFFDRDRAIAGVDTLYLTDDRTPATDGSAGGVQKWTFDGASWKRVATFSTLAGGSQASFRGLAGVDRGSDVLLVASTAENDSNRLVVFVDAGGASPVGHVIATSEAETAFRGIALSPLP